MTPPSPIRDWDPERYRRDAAFVPALARDVVAWLAPAGGERILDLGCGDGALMAALDAGGARVTGIDSSPAQIAAARARGFDARLMAAESLSFDGDFDAVFSNAALHWMLEPDAVIAAVYRALAAGGRFVAEMGGAGNVGAIVRAITASLSERGIDAAPANPWFFPTADDYAARLARAGFEVARIESFARPTDLDCDMEDWLTVFARSFDALVPEGEVAAFHADVAARLRPVLHDSARGRWWVDYVRLRFEAVKP